MKRVVADTGPLVALCDERDNLHRRALKEFDAVDSPLLVCLPVLTEALHFLDDERLRSRLQQMFAREALELALPDRWRALVEQAFVWARRFEGHRPDFTDAFLVAWASTEPSLAVWTFDAEFRNLWRTPKGRPVRMLKP